MDQAIEVSWGNPAMSRKGDEIPSESPSAWGIHNIARDVGRQRLYVHEAQRIESGPAQPSCLARGAPRYGRLLRWEPWVPEKHRLDLSVHT